MIYHSQSRPSLQTDAKTTASVGLHQISMTSSVKSRLWKVNRGWSCLQFHNLQLQSAEHVKNMSWKNGFAWTLYIGPLCPKYTSRDCWVQLLEQRQITPSSVVAKYIEDSLFKNQKDKPEANLKFIFSTASFLFDGAILFSNIKSVYSRPFFIDHQVIRPSALMLTKLSPLFPLPLLIHWISHIALVFLSIDSLF